MSVGDITSADEHDSKKDMQSLVILRRYAAGARGGTESARGLFVPIKDSALNEKRGVGGKGNKRNGQGKR